MDCEVLLTPDMADRGRGMLQAMIDAAPIPVRVSQRYTGSAALLMTYGTGHPVRRPMWQQHRARGGHCIGWDLGYWMHRDGDSYRMRVTLDTDHPPQWIREEAPERFDRDGIALRGDVDPDGPIVLVGLGPKAARVARERPLEWERRTLAAIRAAYPKKTIVYRPKRVGCPLLGGVEIRLACPIEDAIRGASLVVCRHSNVAIDACIAGIPVVCEAGIASALYGKDLRAPVVPDAEARRRFLRSVAWWQYKPEEAALAWTYLLNRLSA